MKANEILDKIKNIVGIELSDEIILTEIKLENGTILVAEKFEAGESVFIKTEDEEVALPLGEYKLEDGKILIVKEEGLIDDILDAVKEQEMSDELETDVELENNPENMEEEKEKKEEEKKEMKYVTKEEFTKAVDEIKNAIEEVKAKVHYDKKKEEEKMSEEAQQEKEELSAVATEPVKHNPEADVKQQFNFKISGSRIQTTKDRVFNKIFNS